LYPVYTFIRHFPVLQIPITHAILESCKCRRYCPCLGVTHDSCDLEVIDCVQPKLFINPDVRLSDYVQVGWTALLQYIWHCYIYRVCQKIRTVFDSWYLCNGQWEKGAWYVKSLRISSTLKNSPVFWPSIYVCSHISQ